MASPKIQVFEEVLADNQRKGSVIEWESITHLKEELTKFAPSIQGRQLFPGVPGKVPAVH